MNERIFKLEHTGEGGFLTAGQFTQVPIDGLVSTVVSSRTEGHLGNDVGSVGRNGDLQFNALGRDLLAEVGNDLDVDLERGSTLHVIHAFACIRLQLPALPA